MKQSNSFLFLYSLFYFFIGSFFIQFISFNQAIAQPRLKTQQQTIQQKPLQGIQLLENKYPELGQCNLQWDE